MRRNLRTQTTRLANPATWQSHPIRPGRARRLAYKRGPAKPSARDRCSPWHARCVVALGGRRRAKLCRPRGGWQLLPTTVSTPMVNVYAVARGWRRQFDPRVGMSALRARVLLMCVAGSFMPNGRAREFAQGVDRDSKWGWCIDCSAWHNRSRCSSRRLQQPHATTLYSQVRVI